MQSIRFGKLIGKTAIIATLLLIIGCTKNQLKTEEKKSSAPQSLIKMPPNVISVNECREKGGKVWNTLGKTSYNGELIGTIKELLCPCVCLIESHPKSNTLWVTINGKKEEFKGDVKRIQTFDDCKKAGFKILNKNPEICMMGEPYMTNGNYRTFRNNPMESGKKCSDYRYSTCPSSCVIKCTPSSCGETKYGIACTSDCDGAGSCMER